MPIERLGFYSAEEVVEFLSPGGPAELPYEDTVTPGTIAQYWRGDKTWQPLNAAAVAFTPTGQIAAITVQLALAELDTEKIATSALDTDGTLAANSDSRIATQKATKTYVDALIAAQDAMVFKGVIDCSSNPNYPAADRGHTYRVSVAGKIGGASGPNVEVGDILLALTDGTAAGNHATVGANWGIIQTNLDGAVIGPASATDGGFAKYDGATGKLLKNSAAIVAVADGGSGASTAAGARTNFGLGTAATQNTGTSGATVPFLNGANTWSGKQTLTAGFLDTSALNARFANTAANPLGSGAGIEIRGVDGVIQSFNRTTVVFAPLMLAGSSVRFSTDASTTHLSIDGPLGNYANDAAAAVGGVPVNGMYRNGSVIMIRVT